MALFAMGIFGSGSRTEENNMPVYDYKCSRCGRRFELVTSISKRDEARCPDCGGEVSRVYQGKCAFGATGKTGGGCSGNCSGCKGCGH